MVDLVVLIDLVDKVDIIDLVDKADLIELADLVNLVDLTELGEGFSWAVRLARPGDFVGLIGPSCIIGVVAFVIAARLSVSPL